MIALQNVRTTFGCHLRECREVDPTPPSDLHHVRIHVAVGFTSWNFLYF